MSTFSPHKPKSAQQVGNTTSVQAFRQTIRGWWSLRTQREKKFLRFCAALLSTVLLWLIAVRPALHTLEMAQVSLPVLRMHAAQAGAIALEAHALRGSSVATHDLSLVVQALESSLSRAGLQGYVSVVADSGPSANVWSLDVNNAPAAALMQWLASLPALVQVQVNSAQLLRAKMNGRDRPGYVSGSIVLGVAKGSQP